MPTGLVNLRTDLKSLKYGHDRQGNGDSGQPYITTAIPNRLSTSPFDDGFIRGGWSLSNYSSTQDQLRISKFLKDAPKGPLFVQRQIGLQLSNPKIETRKINLNAFGILGGLLTAGFNVFNELVPGPTRIYNEGKNTLAQLSVTAFGQHFERHGLSPIQDENTKYLAVARNNNENGNNRLLALKKKLIRQNVTNPRSGNVILGTINAVLGAVNVFNTIIGKGTNPLLPNSPLLQPADLIVDQYSGGPGSNYGIGFTTIRRYDVTSNGSNILPVQEIRGKVNYAGGLGVSNQYFTPSATPPNTVNLISGNFGIGQFGTPTSPVKVIDYNHISLDNPTSKPSQIDQTVINYGDGTYQAGANGTSTSPTNRLYSKIVEQTKTNITQATPNSGSISTKTHTVVYGAKDFKYNLDNLKGVHDRVDSNLLSLVFRIINPFGNPNKDNPDDIVFSAYMTNFRDNFDATWNEYNYVGRSESFYTYGKFKRNINFNLDIPCFNKSELATKHRALGQLASTTAGSYNENNLLGGVLIQLYIGKYIFGQYGILNNVSYEIPQDATWDVDERLAMNIKATFSFTIIHKDLPEYKPDRGFFGYIAKPVNQPNVDDLVTKFTK